MISLLSSGESLGPPSGSVADACDATVLCREVYACRFSRDKESRAIASRSSPILRVCRCDEHIGWAVVPTRNKRRQSGKRCGQIQRRKCPQCSQATRLPFTRRLTLNALCSAARGCRPLSATPGTRPKRRAILQGLCRPYHPPRPMEKIHATVVAQPNVSLPLKFTFCGSITGFDINRSSTQR
jgi:hypothetical protein